MSHGAALGLLTLPAEPSSVPTARRLVREVLAGREAHIVDAAEICISELVTNAVLHAKTEVEVRLEDRGSRIRLEVRDSCPTMPRRLVHTVRSATGRGMEMVSLLATSWGVDLIGDGAKAVWCELDVTLAPAGETADDPEALLAAWPDDGNPFVDEWPVDTDPVLTGPVKKAGERRAVERDGAPAMAFQLVGYPVLRGIRAREHNSAILRECALLSQGATESSAPARLIALAKTMTSAYGGELAAVDQQRMKAYFAGARTVDVRYPFLPGVRATVEAWRDLMDELDTFAEGNVLLTIATPPDLVELRTWTVEEIVRQSEGQPPRPWTSGLE